jgi:hypothetical protein
VSDDCHVATVMTSYSCSKIRFPLFEEPPVYMRQGLFLILVLPMRGFTVRLSEVALLATRAPFGPATMSDRTTPESGGDLRGPAGQSGGESTLGSGHRPPPF